MARLTRSFYVDDVVTGAGDEDQAYALYESAKRVMKEGGFNLRKFHTNSTLLEMRIDDEEASTSQPSTSPSTAEVEETYTSSTLSHPGYPIGRTESTWNPMGHIHRPTRCESGGHCSPSRETEAYKKINCQSRWKVL